MHLVLGQVLGLHGLEGAGAHVQGHGGGLHTFVFQRGQHLVVKVQRGRGCGHRTGVAGKHSLVAFGVFGFVGIHLGVLVALDVGRQRQVAKLVHQLPRRCTVGTVQRKAKQRAILIGPAAQQGGIKTTLAQTAVQVHLGTGQRFFADLHVRDDFIALQHAFYQQLQLAAAGFLAKHPGLDHLGVVEHQQVAFMQQIGQVFENAVDQLRRARIQQAGGAAFGSRVLGNQVLGEHKVKITEGMSAGAERHACS